ncbi:MAG: DUF401 family protein [Candidatus Zixiibacteriota bacterium]
MDALKLGLVLLAIIIALKRKVPVGITLLAMGPLTAVIYQVPLGPLMEGYWTVTRSQQFISLTALVVLITVMGNLLQALGYLGRLSAACQNLPGGARTAVAVLPPLIGLMPMPGGSLLSAPLVNSVLSYPRYSAHFKCAANYWFRHLVEFMWPIYAGVVLTAALTGMSIGRVSLLQAPYTVAMLLIGLLVFTRRIHNESPQGGSLWQPLKGIAGSIWPVAAAVLLYGLLKVELSLAALLALLALIIISRPSRAVLWDAIKPGLAPDLLVLIFGVLSFQKVLDLSGGIAAVTRLATSYHLPEELLIPLVCFVIGMLTGMVSAYIGLGYSLLAGLLYQPELNPGYILLAALGGYMGMMLSPAHLCLILTNQYFGSDLLKVVKTLLPALLMLAAVGCGLYLLGWGGLFA